MIKRSDKKGQFYLLSAIVIISIIIGFSAISNYTRQETQVRIFDLGEELDIESANVLDYGAYNPDEVTDINSFLLDFASNYSEYVGEGTEISFVFGNPKENTATVVNYEEVVLGDIGVGTSTITSTTRVQNETYSTIENVGEKKITKINFNNQEYEFELKPGENFYFVISQEVGQEVHTTRSKR